MKMIIVAAGQGTRLRPFTDEKPKCMVEYNKKPIIRYILETASDCGIDNIAIVNGYKKEVLEAYLKNDKLTFFTNQKFETTNMVSTLFEAKNFMDDDIIISYSDIIYTTEVLDKLLSSQDDFSVVVDKKWKELWLLRMENPLDDAETLKIRDGKIVELGKIAKRYEDIEAQYIGLMKISKKVLPDIINYYESLNHEKLYDKQSYQNMYMTSLIQMLIDNSMEITPVYIEGGWIEIDSAKDLKAYEENQSII